MLVRSLHSKDGQIAERKVHVQRMGRAKLNIEVPEYPALR